MKETTQADLPIGARVQFNNLKTSWLVRAQSEDGRYSLLTMSMFGRVHYTIVDHEKSIRGAMNVIGGGLGIFTTKGPDPAIDEAMDMLRPQRPFEPGETSRPAEARGFEVSHRNQVWVNVTKVTKPKTTVSADLMEVDS